MENETIANITKISILDGDGDKRIVVKLDILREELIFEGHCKIKMNGGTQWQILAVERHGVKEDTDKLNFEEMAKSIHRAMMRKIDMYNLVQAFLHEVTEIEIKKD